MKIIQAALDRVDQEQTVVRAEIAAFERFREAVRPMEIAPEHESGTAGASATLADVRDAYEETVMRTPDYGPVYETDLGNSLAEEFSPKLAEELQATGPLRGDLKRRLLPATETVENQRESFLEVLECEMASLTEAHAELRAVAERLGAIPAWTMAGTSFDEALASWERLDELECRCEHVVADRQRTLVEGNTDRLELGDAFTLSEYLYDGLETTFPVLRAAADVVEEIDQKRTASPSGLREVHPS